MQSEGVKKDVRMHARVLRTLITSGAIDAANELSKEVPVSSFAKKLGRVHGNHILPEFEKQPSTES